YFRASQKDLRDKRFEVVLNGTIKKLDFHTLPISATTNGKYREISNHYPETRKALAIFRADGVIIKEMRADDLRIKALQKALGALPDIEENFGQALFYKLGKDYLHNKLAKKEKKKRRQTRNTQ
ncbi:MAG: hypothetical protein AAFQ08_03505, partial [Bacteroidota bacterium]